MKKLQTKIVGLLMVTALPSIALAQRGTKSPGNPANFTNPTQGFPGFFDTNFAEQGSLVVEWPPLILPIIPMPSIAVDYGVTDTLTVGTNALVSTIPWLVGAKGISVKARTLVYGSETFQSAATVYGGYIGASEINSQWQIFTSNNAWKLAPKHIVSAQAMFLNFGLELGKETSIDYTNIRFSSLAFGGGYQYLFNETLSVNGNLLGAVMNSMEQDTVAANLSYDVNASSGQATWGIARGSLDIRSDDWVYSLGGIYVHGLFPRVLPWFSATTRW